jgi:hypothetical protein
VRGRGWTAANGIQRSNARGPCPCWISPQKARRSQEMQIWEAILSEPAGGCKLGGAGRKSWVGSHRVGVGIGVSSPD